MPAEIKRESREVKKRIKEGKWTFSVQLLRSEQYKWQVLGKRNHPSALHDGDQLSRLLSGWFNSNVIPVPVLGSQIWFLIYWLSSILIAKGKKNLESDPLLRSREVIKQVLSHATAPTWQSAPGSSPLAAFIVSSVIQCLPLPVRDRQGKREKGSGGISNRDAKLSNSKSGSSSPMVSHQEETPFCDCAASTGYFPFHQNCLIWSSRFEAFSVQSSFHILWLSYLFVFLGSFQGYMFQGYFSLSSVLADRHPKVTDRKRNKNKKGWGGKGERATWLQLWGTKEGIYSI